MRHGLKVAVAAGFVGAVVVAAAAFGQTGTPAPGGKQRPNGQQAPGGTQTPGGQQRRPGAKAQRAECGGRAGSRGARAAQRLVHSESKVQTPKGFAVVTLDTGTITAVDAGSRSVTIKRADGETVTATASDQTKVCKDGKKGGLDQLKAGDRAGIAQVDRDGEHRVRAIRAHSPAASSDGAGAQTRPAMGTDILDELSA